MDSPDLKDQRAVPGHEVPQDVTENQGHRADLAVLAPEAPLESPDLWVQLDLEDLADPLDPRVTLQPTPDPSHLDRKVRTPTCNMTSRWIAWRSMKA